MQETANTSFSLPAAIDTVNETIIKKEWIKPEAAILNVNSGGGTMGDGPDTRFSFAS